MFVYFLVSEIWYNPPSSLFPLRNSIPLMTILILGGKNTNENFRFDFLASSYYCYLFLLPFSRIRQWRLKDDRTLHIAPPTPPLLRQRHSIKILILLNHSCWADKCFRSNTIWTFSDPDNSSESFVCKPIPIPILLSEICNQNIYSSSGYSDKSRIQHNLKFQWLLQLCIIFCLLR